MTRKSETKFIRKSVEKMLLTKIKGQFATKINMNEIIRQIGIYIGRIGRNGEKAVGGFTSEEVGELLDNLTGGFLEGYSN